MADLSLEMAELDAALGSRPGAGGRAVLFASLEADAEAAEVARAYALHKARSARRGVWLFDLDLLQNGQHRYFKEHAERYGSLGASVRSSPDGTAFISVRGDRDEAVGPADDASFISAQAVGPRRLWVTRFRTEQLKAGQRAHILTDGAYWRALRAHADQIVVDAPPVARSEALLAVAAHMDWVVIVASAARREPERIRALESAIAHAGGRCAGLVLRGLPPGAPAGLMRLFT